jgi:hypothetical protein
MGDHDPENVAPTERKLGWKPSDPEKMRLRFGDVLDMGIELDVPPNVDFLNNISDWDMALNDQLQCCTASAFDHLFRSWSKYAQGIEDQFTDDDIIEFYAGSTGYRPGNPESDQVGIMTDVLSYARKIGMAGHRIDAYVKVNANDPVEAKKALYIAGGLYVGMNFPDSAMHQFDVGQPWDVVRHARNLGGHCIHVGAIDAQGNWFGTSWGRVVKLTPAFVDTYVIEVEAPLSAEWIKDNFSGAGIDVITLNAHLQQLTGQPGGFTVTQPTPNPTPAPEPKMPAALALLLKNIQLTLRATDRMIGEYIKNHSGS